MTRFSKGWKGCSQGNPDEQPSQPSENPVPPSSFTPMNPILQQLLHWYNSSLQEDAIDIVISCHVVSHNIIKTLLHTAPNKHQGPAVSLYT